MIYFRHFETKEEYEAYMKSGKAVFPNISSVGKNNEIVTFKTQVEFDATIDPWEDNEKSFFGFGGDAWDFAIGMTWEDWINSNYYGEESGVFIADNGKVVTDGGKLELINLENEVQYAGTNIVPVTNYLVQVISEEPEESGETTTTFFGFNGIICDLEEGMTWRDWVFGKLYNPETEIFISKEDTVLAYSGDAEVVDQDGNLQASDMPITPIYKYLARNVKQTEPEEWSGETSTFGFEDYKYEYGVGMTWNEWVLSKFYRSETGIYIGKNGEIFKDNAQLILDNVLQFEFNEIEGGRTYELANTQEEPEPEVWTGETSTFGFGHEKYEFGVGMTWGDWVNSQFYNKETGIYIDKGGEVMVNGVQLCEYSGILEFIETAIEGGNVYITLDELPEQHEEEKPEEEPEPSEEPDGSVKAFVVGDYKLLFEDGMSWHDFINSKYNDGQFIDLFIGKDGRILSNGGTVAVIDKDKLFVTEKDIIMEYETYYLTNI